jgi:hypothetical protein
MKDDELEIAKSIIKEAKRKTDFLVKELDKKRKSSFDYKGETIKVDSNYNKGAVISVFSTENSKNPFMISQRATELECSHLKWRTPDFAQKFKTNEIDKAILFGLEKIMFSDCSMRTLENTRPVNWRQVDNQGWVDYPKTRSEFWWFVPKDKPYSYVGDWDDENPALGKIYKVFANLVKEFAAMSPPLIEKLFEKHPCCQTSSIIYSYKRPVTKDSDQPYGLPLHNLNSDDRQFLKNIASTLSKVPIKNGTSKGEYLGEFWSCGYEDLPGESEVWINSSRGKKAVILTKANKYSENIEGFKQFQNSIWDLEYSNKTKEILGI